MSSCPLLVSLRFQECTGLKTINVVKEVSKYLIHFTVINKTNPPDCDITIDAPGLEKIRIVFSNVRLVHSGTYINLKCLYLMKARLSPDSFNGSLWEFRNDDPFQLWRLEYFTSTYRGPETRKICLCSRGLCPGHCLKACRGVEFGDSTIDS